jgi:hypothetical protein
MTPDTDALEEARRRAMRRDLTALHRFLEHEPDKIETCCVALICSAAYRCKLPAAFLDLIYNHIDRLPDERKPGRFEQLCPERCPTPTPHHAVRWYAFGGYAPLACPVVVQRGKHVLPRDVAQQYVERVGELLARAWAPALQSDAHYRKVRQINARDFARRKDC